MKKQRDTCFFLNAMLELYFYLIKMFKNLIFVLIFLKNILIRKKSGSKQALKWHVQISSLRIN